MPTLKIKKNGKWEYAAIPGHTHKTSDITDLNIDIPNVSDVYDETSSDAMSGKAVAEALETIVQAQPDWNQEDSTASDYIKNKPEIPSVDGLATKEYVDEQIALIDIPESGGTFEQVQADWDETDTTSPAYIKNKPVISGDGGASVQANWAQTDETAADFIKNKPFYEYEGREELLPLTTYAGFYLDSDYNLYSFGTLKTYGFVAGETYTIQWDGIEYICTAQDASILMDGAIGLGNCAAFDLEGNDEPFIIASIEGMGTMFFALTDTEDGGSHSVQITQEKMLVKQINKKFIPIPFFGKEDSVILDGVFQDEKYDGDGDGIDDTWYGEAMIEDSSDATLVIGETYTVTWNSVEYRCECIEVYGLPAVGNTIVMGGEDNGIPFAIGRRDASGAVAGVPCWVAMPVEFEDDGTYHCTISGNSIKKVDLQYLYQPDWNENNRKSGSYIANKPFGEITAGTIIVPEQNVNLTIDIAGNGILWASVVPNMGLSNYIVEGKNYNINFDGSYYMGVGVAQDGIDAGVVYESDSITILIADDIEGVGSSIIASNQSGQHTVSVICTEDIITKIDPKYLPDDIGGDNSLPEVNTSNDGQVMTVVNGEWTAQTPASGLPTVTTSDAGKFLRVDTNGIWVVQSVPSAEGVSF